MGSLSRRVAALIVLSGLLLLALMVVGVPFALAYDVVDDGGALAPDPRGDGAVQQGPVAEPPLESAVPTGQLDQAEALLRKEEANDPSELPPGGQATQSGTPPTGGDGQDGPGVPRGLGMLAPFVPRQDATAGKQPAGETGDEGQPDPTDQQVPASPAAEPPKLDPDLAARDALVQTRIDAIQPKYEAATDTFQRSLDGFVAANPQAGRAPDSEAVSQAAALVRVDQTELAPLQALRHAQDGQRVALRIIQEARNARAEAARVIAEEEAARAQLQVDIGRVQAYGELDLAVESHQQLARYDQTDQSTRLGKARLATDDVIPRTIAAAENLLAAYEREESTAAALQPLDVREGLAGWVPAGDRLFAHQTARDKAYDALMTLRNMAGALPKVEGAPGLDLPTVRAVSDREELPGWTRIDVNVHADLGPRGFPGEGAPLVVPGHATENRVKASSTGQAAIAEVPAGGALFIEPEPWTVNGKPALVDDRYRVVSVAADAPGRLWSPVRYVEPTAADQSMLSTPAPGQIQLRQWVDSDLAVAQEEIRARTRQVTDRYAAILKTIDEQRARLAALRSDDRQRRRTGEAGALDADIAVAQAALARSRSILAPVGDQLLALEWQAVTIDDENGWRQRRRELERVIQTLQDQRAQVVANGGSAASLAPYDDAGTPLRKAIDEYQLIVPDIVNSVVRKRTAWRELETAAAAVTPTVLADARIVLPVIELGNRALGWEAAYSHARALAVIKRSSDAKQRAQALAPTP